MNKFDGLISLGEAAKLFDKSESTLKKGIERGKFKEGIDAKKFGKQWVMDIDALEREYGKIGKKKITKNQCYQIAKEFCDLDDHRLNIVLNSNQDLEIKKITPDTTENDKVLYKSNNEYLKKQNLADYLYKKIEG